MKFKNYSRDSDVWIAYVSRLEDSEIIRNTYKEYFSTPKPNMDKLWKLYESWEIVDEIKQKTKEIYLKSFPIWVQEEEFYNILHKTENYSMGHLKSYIDAAKDQQKKYIFEECLLKSPKTSDFWMEYITFSFNDKLEVIKICKRAVRNCFSNINLWSYLILCYEQLGKPFESNILHRKIWKCDF